MLVLLGGISCGLSGLLGISGRIEYMHELSVNKKRGKITAEEAINIIENQFGVKLFEYQKFILKVLWKNSQKKNLKN